MDVGGTLAPLVTLGVAATLVGVRGEVRPEVIALALALTVSLGGRFGGRLGGVTSALMAAASFDFLHTQPYLSLKISNGTDILITVLLLVVGLVVGGLAGRATDDRRRARERGAADRLLRVLAVARDGNLDDLETAVRGEMVGVLGLRACSYTSDAQSLPVVGPNGELDLPRLRFARGGFELPDRGVAVPVAAQGRTFGYLVCLPTPGVGVRVESRQTAAALGEVLGLAINASCAAA
jgi:hypothetical protein